MLGQATKFAQAAKTSNDSNTIAMRTTRRSDNGEGIESEKMFSSFVLFACFVVKILIFGCGSAALVLCGEYSFTVNPEEPRDPAIERIQVGTDAGGHKGLIGYPRYFPLFNGSHWGIWTSDEMALCPSAMTAGPDKRRNP